MSLSQPVVQGAYVLARRHEQLVFTAGMTPRDKGVLMFSGQLQTDVCIDSLKEAVVLATRNALAAARSVMTPDEGIAQVLNTTVYVSAVADFTRHSAVADLASAYLHDTLGEAGRSARTAVGVSSLPGDAPVEVQLVLVAAPTQAPTPPPFAN